MKSNTVVNGTMKRTTTTAAAILMLFVVILLGSQAMAVKYRLNTDNSVNIVSTSDPNDWGSVSEKEALEGFKNGTLRPMTNIERQGEQARRQKAADSPGEAFFNSAVSMITFGITDLLSSESEREWKKMLVEENPLASAIAILLVIVIIIGIAVINKHVYIGIITVLSSGAVMSILGPIDRWKSVMDAIAILLVVVWVFALCWFWSIWFFSIDPKGEDDAQETNTKDEQ